MAIWMLLAAAIAPTAAIGPTPADAAGLLVADGGFGGVLRIKDHDVRVTINNGVAVTEIEQVFVNTEQRVVEALYTFPVPKDASVSNFSMWIGGKEMIGEVVEKERARQIYESYKQKRRDPGLLEQVDYKRFEMRIFPIPAGAEQRVRITYCQELDFDHDRANYVYPLATVTQAVADQRTSGRFSLALDVKSEVPITEMKSPSHPDRFVIVQHANPHYWQASFETDGGDLSRDLVIDYGIERPRTGINLIASKSGNEDGYFQLTMTAGKELESQLNGSDYVFVVDVSGSMMHDGKLAMSRDSINAFVQSLDDKDRFELIAFNIAPKPLFNSVSPVNEETKRQAEEFLRSQQARGGTVLNPAIEAAYRYHDNDRQLNVVVLSDGMTEQREQRELLQLIAGRPAGVTVFCVGVGNEVNRPLLAQLANDTGGLAAFMSTGTNFEQQAQAFRRKLVRPAATNVKITLEGADVYDVEPEKLPNLFHGQPVRLYGRYKKSGPAKVQIKAEVLGNPFEQTIDVTMPDKDSGNPEIERMWASHRVERLMAQDRADGSNGRFAEIVRLCEGYSIASQYASFIVLENDAEYRRWKIERRNATRIERDRAAQVAVRERLDQLRRDTAQQLGPRPPEKVATNSAESLGQPIQLARQDQSSPSPPVQPGDFNLGSRPNPGVSTGGGSAGGGAIDPLTALAAASLAGFGWACRRNKRSKRTVNAV
jgi:Ca-activated chloride channel homolog